MKIGFLSDAHGNPGGVQICLECFRKLNVDDIFFLGDAVGYFPDAKRTIDLLEIESVNCLIGNHDAMLLGHLSLDVESEEIYKIKETRERLDSHYLEKIASWLPMKEIEIEGRRILCVHGSPWNPLNGYVYPNSNIQHFSYLPFDIVFIGHTHRPFIRKSGSVVIVNVGSSSLPRDQGNQSSCAVYDSCGHTITVIRIPFNENELIELYKDSIHFEVVDTLQRKDESGAVRNIIEELS